MKNQQNRVAVTNVAAEQQVAAPALTLRQQRLIALGQAYLQRSKQAKLAKHQAAQVAWEQHQAAMQQKLALENDLQAIAAKHGVALEQLMQAALPRANSATPKPSAAAIVVNGELLTPCKAVHALCASNPTLTRKQLVALAVQHGINENTAQTQYGVFKAKNK